MVPTGPMTSSRRDEHGASLLSLLLVLIILGVAAALTVGALGGTPGTTLPTSPGVTTTAKGETPGDVSAAALHAECIADFESLNIALQVYESLHGANPVAGTSWVSTVPSGNSIMESWPSDPGHFTFAWNGSDLSVTPHRGLTSRGSLGAQQPSSGCYASLG